MGHQDEQARELDAAANKLINDRWVNKDGRTTGESAIYGLSFNELHGMLVRFALENWDGTANGQEITLTGCANMMRQYKRDAAASAGRAEP